MTTRFSTLAALVVTFASLALGGCAADAEGSGAELSESSISDRETSGDLHAEESVKLGDMAKQANESNLRREATADAKIAGGKRVVVTPGPGRFENDNGVHAIEALEAVAPSVGGPKLDVDMPDLTQR